MYNPRDGTHDDEAVVEHAPKLVSDVIAMDIFRTELAAQPAYVPKYGPDPMGRVFLGKVRGVDIDKEALILGGICLVGCIVMAIVF